MDQNPGFCKKMKKRKVDKGLFFVQLCWVESSEVFFKTCILNYLLNCVCKCCLEGVKQSCHLHSNKINVLKFSTRRSTFQKRTYRYKSVTLNSASKTWEQNLTKPFTAHLPCMNTPDLGPEHVGSYSSVSQSHPSLHHPFLLWTGDKQNTWLNFKLL